MRIVLALAAIVLNSASLFAQADTKADAAIRRQVSALEMAWNKRDAAALAALYTKDADVIMVDSPLLTGRPAVQVASSRDMAQQTATRRISITPTRIRFLNPNVAIVNTLARFNEGAVKEDRGTWIMTRHNGRWLIAALRVLPAERN